MSKAVVSVATLSLVQLVAVEWIVVWGVFVPVVPLSTPAVKVTISNVAYFLREEELARNLVSSGKITIPIRWTPLGCTAPEIQHVLSFCRLVYTILNNALKNLDVSLKYRIGERDYSMLVATKDMACFHCV